MTHRSTFVLTLLAAGLVASQILGAALCRYVLRLAPVVGMSRTELIGWLGPTVQRYITAPFPGSGKN